MSYKLFSLKEGDIIINKLEILTVPTFTTILRRDKGSDGDSTGRKKLQAFKEFAYIYHMGDVKSLPNRNGYTSKAAVAYSKDAAGLSVDWVADSVIKDAIRIYRKEQDSLPRRTILDLLRTYNVIGKVTGKLRLAIESAADEDSISVEKAAELFKTIALLIEQGDELPKLTAKLTSAISQLEQIEEKSNREIKRGSESFVPDSAYPDRQL